MGYGVVVDEMLIGGVDVLDGVVRYCGICSGVEFVVLVE